MELCTAYYLSKPTGDMFKQDAEGNPIWRRTTAHEPQRKRRTCTEVGREMRNNRFSVPHNLKPKSKNIPYSKGAELKGKRQQGEERGESNKRGKRLA